MKKPDPLKSEIEQTVENSEPELKQFKPRIELMEKDLEKVSGGCIKVLCTTYLQN